MVSFQILQFWTRAILFGFILGVQCVGNRRSCYDVGDQETCFFQPNSQIGLLNVAWETAWTTCKRLNATLPIVRSDAIQSALQTYIGSLRWENVGGVWMAGREIRRLSWWWSNGKPFTEPAHLLERPYYVQAILTDELNYEEHFPGNKYKYICQYFGTACQSEDAISLSSGCLLLNNGEALTLYDARNRCVESGGDLAVIDSTYDLERFRDVFRSIRKATKLWIGLRRQWWLWNATDAASSEMKYSNWKPDNGFKPDRVCSAVALDDYRWTQESCDCCKTIVCQTGAMPAESSGTDKPNTTTPVVVVIFAPSVVMAAAIVASVAITILIVIVTVIVTLVVRKRKKRSSKKVRPKESSYESLQQNLQEMERFGNEPNYTELRSPRNEAQLHVGVAQNVLQPTTARAELHRAGRQQQQQHNYINEAEMRATRIPSYLEMVR